jgi:hypothetical protein
MLNSFSDWLYLKEAFQSYFLFGLCTRPLNENTDANPSSGEVCVKTPISAYLREIEFIKAFAQTNADQMAQVLMFSPLTANVSFSAHWDNFPIIMNILKTLFPDKISKENIMKTSLKNIPLDIKGTGDDSRKTIYDEWPNDPAEILSAIFHTLNVEDAKVLETVAGWKYDTIVHIWNNRHELYERLMAAKNDDDETLIRILAMIPGAGPVKAGFMAQLIFGRIGCIDTHNVDIYRKVFPDLVSEIDPELWNIDKKFTKKDIKMGLDVPSKAVKPIRDYLGTINKLAKRNIGSQQLWDVWVDFVANFYKMNASVNKPGGPYAQMGAALDPNSPEYAMMQGMKIPKTQKNRKWEVPLAVGSPEGGGASLTHILAAKKPEEMLRQLQRHVDPSTKEPEDWARSVNLRGDLPRAVKYGFTTALSPEGINTDKFQDIIGHHVRRASGVKVDPQIRREIDAIYQLPKPRSLKRNKIISLPESYSEISRKASNMDVIKKLKENFLVNSKMSNIYLNATENPSIRKELKSDSFFSGYEKMITLIGSDAATSLALFEFLHELSNDREECKLRRLKEIIENLLTISKESFKSSLDKKISFSSTHDDWIKYARDNKFKSLIYFYLSQISDALVENEHAKKISEDIKVKLKILLEI